MALGDAAEVHRRTGARVALGHPAKARLRWSPVFDNVPFLVRPEQARSNTGKRHVVWVHNYSGHRPYVDYEAMAQVALLEGVPRHQRNQIKYASRWVWRSGPSLNGWRPRPAPVVLSDTERRLGDTFARRYPGAVIIAPDVKNRASPNKQWGRRRWEALVPKLLDLGPVVQLGPAGTRPIPRAAHHLTRNFREVLAVMGHAAVYVGHEGGSHHAAAAFRRPGVVIFGGFIGPEQTGYDWMVNLTAGGEPCGSRRPCQHCRDAMATITPEDVREAARSALERGAPAT